MKKHLILLLIFVSVLAIALFAADKPAYEVYYEARAEARECWGAGEIPCASAKFLEAEKAALAQEAAKKADDTTDWVTIADWQRNNAGYCMIEYQGKAKVRNLKLIAEALYILEQREVKSPAVKPTYDKNVIYCKTQLGIPLNETAKEKAARQAKTAKE